MMAERGLSVAHSTIFRWVQDYAPEIYKRIQPYLKQTNDSWRVDETNVKVRGKWMYLYRAVDWTGQTLDFLLNETRSTRAAKRFAEGEARQNGRQGAGQLKWTIIGVSQLTKQHTTFRVLVKSAIWFLTRLLAEAQPLWPVLKIIGAGLDSRSINSTHSVPSSGWTRARFCLHHLIYWPYMSLSGQIIAVLTDQITDR
jgi:hypothetical protein